MRKITILVLLMAMLTSVVFGLSTMASAEAEPIKVKVSAYNMQNSASFPWQANAEDEYCVFTGATDLNTGETNDVIVEFTAPAAGTINIANNWTFCANTSGAGDGARVRLIHNDVQLYPTDARWAEIPVDNSNVFINVGEVAVEQGDKIYMVFNNGGNFSNASDSIYYCLGFTFNGNWFGSNDYWYATAEEGAATVTFAGVTCPKAELIQYKYGFVSDNAQGNVMAEGEFADANLGTLVGTTHDGVDRFKGNENSFCQFEAIGMNVVAGTPNLIKMKMTADGVFNFQNSYFKTFNNPATVEVIKNDKVIATHTVGGALSTLDAMQAVAVKANDDIYVRVTAESGAYLRYVVNGVLATANGVVSYNTRDTVLNAGFPNPKGMVDELHAMGFKVVLWACPFISADSKEFRYLRREDMLVKNADGSVAIREWWDGFSAVVDLTNPKTEKWFTGKLDALMENFGFDGFKLDAGDQFYYRDDDVTYGGGSAIDSSKAWSKLGTRYAYTEFRSSINMGGKSMVQRLRDKQHSYEGNGLAAIVPATLMQHLFGYYFTCPDMIGGGEFSAFGEGKPFDEQLMVRFCQCSAMLPMMQFSIAPWRILSKENYVKVQAAAETRKVLAEAYKCLFYGLNSSAEPIVRLLEYNYPGCGYERITDEFMIGEEFLCVPIVEPSITEKTVILPQGKWLYNGEEIDGGEYTLKVTADTMPIFKRFI